MRLERPSWIKGEAREDETGSLIVKSSAEAIERHSVSMGFASSSGIWQRSKERTLRLTHRSNDLMPGGE